MWVRLYNSIVLVYLIHTSLAKHDKDVTDLNNEESESAIFASVIKNITRVNEALQELISNYEHLQKIYKSQEEYLQVESSDPEIDEVYKNKNKKNGLKRSKQDSLTTHADDAYPATQMIWSEKDSKSEQDTDKENDKSNSDKTESVKRNIAIKPPSEPPLKQAEIIFIDAHRPITKKNKPKPPLEPILTPRYKTPKTRYDKVSQSKYINIKNKNVNEHLKGDNNTSLEIAYEPTANETDSRSVLKPKSIIDKKLTGNKPFSLINNWDDIIGNKFIQLQAHSELSLEKMRKHNVDNRSMQEMRLRSNNIKSDLDFNETQIEKVKTPQEKQIDEKLLNSDTDDVTKEALQANLLREAYGDACLKVVVKKCFKACKAANKEVCRRYKCKESYKKHFYDSVKESCTKEFSGDTSKGASKETSFYKRNIRDENKGVQTKISTSKPDGFEDLTRNGYLRSCLPHLQMREMTRRSIDIADAGANATTFPDDPIPNFNVLRDKYERACQKISHKKCQNACKSAYEEVCESFTCNSGRKRAYKKQCRVKCKDVYRKGYSSHDSKSSKSTSSDSSSDDSDESSDDSSS